MNGRFLGSPSLKPTVAKVPALTEEQPWCPAAHQPDLAHLQARPHSALMSEAINMIVLSVLERAPEWLRHDLSAKDPAVRTRAEETLAAMIVSALVKQAPSV